MSREIKVGLLVVVALAVLAAGIFMVGERQNLLSLKNTYSVRLATVSGLAAGNPVQLNGVTVGKVEEVVLPVKVEDTLLTVWITVDRRFAARVREDSTARIKTLGLLGDKYIELTSGSVSADEIPDGGEIRAAAATDVDKLIASGEDVVENVMAISVSLKNILARMEAGKGLLGELTTDQEAGLRAKEALVATFESIRSITDKIEHGDGTLATLVNDDSLLTKVDEAIARLEKVLAKVDTGEGALPALLNDASTRERMERALDNLTSASDSLASVAGELESGDGLLKKLISDDELGREVADDLRKLIRSLSVVAEKLEQGEGTLGKMIEDPSVYEAIDDIVVGINESKLLRWLVRNRQKAGIKKRYQEETAAPTAPAAPAPEAEPR